MPRPAPIFFDTIKKVGNSLLEVGIETLSEDALKAITESNGLAVTLDIGKKIIQGILQTKDIENRNPFQTIIQSITSASANTLERNKIVLNMTNRQQQAIVIIGENIYQVAIKKDATENTYKVQITEELQYKNNIISWAPTNYPQQTIKINNEKTNSYKK